MMNKGGGRLFHPTKSLVKEDKIIKIAIPASARYSQGG